jgi:hypothetical protein
MKIGGIDHKTLCNECLLVLPRSEQNLVFRARGLKDMDVFNARCPQPKPPGKMTRDGVVPLDNDPAYQTVLGEWAKKRLGFIVVNSLEPSQIEWDSVNLDDPRTWTNWESDFRGGGLSEIECSRVLSLVLEANALDESKLQKARESFLLGQVQKSEATFGLASEQVNTPSGELVQG